MRFFSNFSCIKVLVFLLLLSLLQPYCSKTEKDISNIELSVVFVQSWGDDVNTYFKELVAEWGSKNNIKVNLEIVPIKDIDLKMTAWIQSPVGDLALLPTNLAMVNTSSLADLTELSQSLSKQVGGYYDIGKDMGAIQGKWYNIPFCAWPHVWFYRTDLLKGWQGGLPKTYEEAKVMFEWLKKNHPEIIPLGIGLGQDEDFSMFLQAIIWAYGGGIVAKDGKTVDFNNEKNKQAFQFILDLYNNELMPKGALGWDGASNNNQFLAKKIAITANALSIDYVAKRRNPEFYEQITHSVYPSGPSGHFSFVQTFGWTIKRECKNRIIAEKFLKYLYGKAILEELFLKGEGAIAPLQKAIGEMDFWKKGKYSDAISSVASAKSLGWPGPFTREAAEVFNRRILNSIFARVINDGLTLDQAIQEATEKIKSIYRKM